MIASRARAAAAGCLCIGFDGHEVSADAKSLLREGVRNVILFTRNGEGQDHLRSLTSAIQDHACAPVLISVDHEGGRVQRFRAGFTEIPPMRRVGAAPSLVEACAAARETAHVIARELAAVGIHLDYAPVVDVDTNPANPVIADRAFSRDPAVVAACGSAFIAALQAGGVAACAKHFPGHGDTSQDSHLELPRLAHGMERLRSVELPPFRAASAAGVAFIMTAHVLFEAIDPLVPATMSRRVLTDLLRGEIGFDGVIITDCLEMQAIADRFDVGDAAVAAIEAGADLVLCCHRADRQRRIIDALSARACTDTAFAERLSESAARVARTTDRYARGALVGR